MSLLLYLLDLALLASLVLVPGAWLVRPLSLSIGQMLLTIPWSGALILVPPGILLLRTVLHNHSPGNGFGKYSAFKNLALALAATFTVFLGVEQFLKLIGYEAHVPPIVIVGQNDSDTQSNRLYLDDPRLLFRFRPGAEFNGRTVNRMGFLDREVDPAKKPGAVRVICMGDSVSGQMVPPYSGHLNAKLVAAPPDARAWESFNMAVHGYTSVQGLRLFELQASSLKPDYVVIMYGWNDHWLSPLPDSSRMARELSPGRAKLYGILRAKRFGRLLLSFSNPSGRVQKTNPAGVRVPPLEYQQTLRRFVAAVRDAGATPILMTPARAVIFPRALVRRGQAASVEEAVRLHDEYNDIVRAVALDTGTPLIDLARMLSGEEFAGLFSDDGIHFSNRDGVARIADEVYKKIGELAKTRPQAADRRRPLEP
jgi:lysophospholipase L1-like esterase